MFAIRTTLTVQVDRARGVESFLLLSRCLQLIDLVVRTALPLLNLYLVREYNTTH